MLIDQRQTELDLVGPGTPTTPIGPARGGNPGRASWCRLTHDHALDFLLAVEALRRPDAVYVGMIASRTKRATFTRYAANEGVDARSLVCPIGASFPRDRRPEVMAAFAAAEIQTRMIERAHQGGRSRWRPFWPLEDRALTMATTHSDADPPRPSKL